MSRPVKDEVVREHVTEHEMRDQEVLRANKVLVAYFKGRRTEREARAALKVIKAFIRERERTDLRSRRPLPGAESTTAGGRIKARMIKMTRKKAVRSRVLGRLRDNSADIRPGNEAQSVANGAQSRDGSN